MTILSVGDTLADRYVIEAFLAQGGMQEVYKANDTTFNRYVALKVPKNSSAERRFKVSAEASARINHPTVAKTLDYFDENGRGHIVEELVNGPDLGILRKQVPRLDPSGVAYLLHHLSRGGEFQKRCCPDDEPKLLTSCDIATGLGH
ncbi:MAG: hypothetical protein ACYCW6_26385 [Candidatus Xenobia bacterium]